MKLLKDYPRNEWLLAADRCQFCRAPYSVKVKSLHEGSNSFGTVLVSVEHKSSCLEVLEGGSDRKIQSYYDVAGWEFSEKPVNVWGRKFTPLKARANIGPCQVCWKLVVGVPLILFLDEGRKGEIDLCWECAMKPGFLELATRQAPHVSFEDKLKGGIERK